MKNVLRVLVYKIIQRKCIPHLEVMPNCGKCSHLGSWDRPI